MYKQNRLMSYLFVVLITLGMGFKALAQSTGTFTVVKGDVQVTSASGTTEKAKVGKKVNPSDVITAGADSRAKIVMADKNVINISPDTKMALEKYIFDPKSDNKQVTLNVMYGKVRATVEQKYDGEKNKFHIKTPAAVAGVRGTDFLTSFSPKTRETKIITFEGRVAVGLAGPGGQILNPVYVTPGQMTTATQGAPPAPPVSVPTEEFQKVNSDSNSETATKSDNGPGDAGAPAKEEKAEEKKEDAKASESGQTEETKKEDSKKDEAKKDEVKKEEPAKKEDSKREDSSKKDTASTEEPKSNDKGKSEPAKKEEPRKEANSNSPSKSSEQSSGSGSSSSPGSGSDTSRSPASASSSSGEKTPGSTATTAPGSAATSGNTVQGNAPPPPPKAPLTPGTMMLDRTDLAPTVSQGVLTPTLQNAMPVVNNFTPYVPPAPPTQQYIQQVNQIIQNTNTHSKVNIIIKRAP